MFDNSPGLDPSDWDAFRRHSHQALDAMLDYLAAVGQRPVWQPPPAATQERFHAPLPLEPTPLGHVQADFMEHVVPYAVGNAHPGFMGWVHGGGNVVGVLAEMMAAALNSNLGGRDQVPIAVEQQIVRWMAQLLGFPAGASGLMVTGSSLANWIALLVARRAAVGTEVRSRGLASAAPALAAYAAQGTHGCIARGLDLSGLGSDALRLIATDARRRIDIEQLQQAIAADRAAGARPFCVIGNAGTVDTGAIDDLAAIATVARREQIWFHVDGACGALGVMSPRLKPRFAGIELADSVALDFHKWAQVPYEAGFVLVRDRRLHHSTFAAPAAYLGRAPRGLAAGDPWPCDYGPDLSRSFKALKVWFTLRTYGIERLGAMMEATCELAHALAERVARQPELELLAPVELNIVCFRFRHPGDVNRLNAQLVIALQESGLVAPSSTELDGRVAIRAAVFNHRTSLREIDLLIDSSLRLGRALQGSGDYA